MTRGNIWCSSSLKRGNERTHVRFALLMSPFSETRKMRPSEKPNLAKGMASLSLVQKQAWYGLCDEGNRLLTPRSALALKTSVRAAPKARTRESGDLKTGPGGKLSPVEALMEDRYSCEESSAAEGEVAELCAPCAM